MILFALQCVRGDRFEGWFRSNGDYEIQAASGRVACPFCGTVEVTKALMAPAIPARTRNAPAAKDGDGVARPGPPAAPSTAIGAGPDVVKAVKLMQHLAREVRARSDYVGPRFAEEARRIHYDEAPARSIYGEASPAEMQALAEEGVGFHPLPSLPEDHN